MIRDINAQIEKALNEVEMRYSKGMKFSIYDLLATKVCENESNFSTYKNRLQAQLSPKRTAQLYSTRNGINTYIKL